MILVRDTFRVKFGKMKDAVAALKSGEAMFRSLGSEIQIRALTDLTGPYYTLVLEMTLPDLAAWEQSMREGFSSPAWQAWYTSFSPLLEGGHREIYTVVL